MALPSPEQLDAMATQIANCGADLQVIRGKIQAAVQGASGQQIPGVMEDVNQISSSVSAAQEKANAAAAKLRAKAQAVRQAYGGGWRDAAKRTGAGIAAVFFAAGGVVRIDGDIPDDVPAIIETMDSVGDFIEENYLEEAAEEILKQVNSNAKVER